ncbi:MAG: hypothetical protein IJW46_04935, partial [Clostridia bacterium]|nr:hypothetical protein [Clostridia bacterium]
MKTIRYFSTIVIALLMILTVTLAFTACQDDDVTTEPNITTTPEGDTTVTTMKTSVNTNPGTLPTAAYSIGVGEKKTLTLSANYKVEFISTDTSIVAVGDTLYDKETKMNTVEVVGVAEGNVNILAVKTDDFSSALLSVSVRSPLKEGETANRSVNAIFTSDPANSPANETAANLGDENIATKWLIFGNTATIYADLGYTCEISSFSLTSANDDQGRDPMNFELYGSIDGEVWIDLFAIEGEIFESRHQSNFYDLYDTGEYRYYKLEITQNHGDPMVQLAEFSLFEEGKAIGGADVQIPTKTPIASSVSGVTLSHDRLILAEGDSFVLTANAVSQNGQKSPVYFVSSDPALKLVGMTYHEQEGKTQIQVNAEGAAKGQLVAFTADGLRIKSIDFSLIAEGACNNVTEYFEAKGANGNQAVNVKSFFDDKRLTVKNINLASFDIILSTDNKTVLVNRYAIVGGNNLDTAPKSWKFYGSNDGVNWTLLDERNNESFEGEYLRRIFDFDNTTYYAKYKLTLSGEGDMISLSEVQLFELGKYPSWALGPFEKVDEANPILTPNDVDYFLDPISGTNVYWSNEALYNPAAVVKDGVICVLYRSQDHPLVSRVGLALSLDGIHFDSLTEPVLYPENDEFYPFEVGGGDEDPRVVKGPDGTYYMYYSAYNREKGICRLYVATSKDLENWTKHGNAIGDAYNGKYKDAWAKSGSVICDMVGEEFIARKFEDGKYY